VNLTEPQRRALWRAAQAQPGRAVHCGRLFRAFESLEAMGLGTYGRDVDKHTGRWSANFTANDAGREQQRREEARA